MFLLFQNPEEYHEPTNTVSLAARSCHIENFTSSSKQEIPNVKIDMEAKLRAWLESKGKTKCIQKMDGLFSPIASKTLLSMTHILHGTIHSSYFVTTISHKYNTLKFPKVPFFGVSTSVCMCFRSIFSVGTRTTGSKSILCRRR